MDGRTLFTELRNVLATLYLLPTDARRIATEAGLDLRQIAFDAKAVNNWDNILTVAIEYNALDAVLAIAYAAHPKYQPFVQILESYRHFVAAGGQLEAPPLLLNRNEGRTSPMMALAPPSDYVQRTKEFTQLVNYLLAGNEQPVAITATIRGAGGFGKTTLAQAICEDERIRAAFPDGILWTTVGDEKANVLLGLRKFYQALTGREAQFVDQQDATAQLSSVLADRRCLLVIDDVWNAAHLQPFLEGGKQCARLVTTRIASVIPKEANVVALDAMQMREATHLLGAGLKHPDFRALANLAQRLGEWPLLLKLVNRRLYEDVTQQGIRLTDAIAAVNEELDQLGLTTFDVMDVEERSQAVAASMGVSLRRLNVAAPYGRIQIDEVTRFRELAIFPEDARIPLATLALLWQQSAIVTERLCRRLADLALILRYDGQTQTVLLHDVTRHYLLSQAATDQLVDWHRALLAGYQRQCGGEWWQLPTDGYIYQHLLWHLQEAQQQEVLEGLLFTYEWLDAKLQATDIVSLIHDFDFRSDKGRQAQGSLLKHALQMSISVIARDKDQLVSQLYGRLQGLGKPWVSFIDEVVQQKRVRWLQSKEANLMGSGGNLLYTLSGHTAGVSNLLLTPDGRLLSSCSSSSSSDTSVKVWDIEQGVLLHSLEGHTDGVSNLLLTPDGRLLSSCSGSSGRDTSVKVWDIEQGVLLHSLEGHTAGVDNLLLTPDGRLLSSCSGRDTSVKVWDIKQGVLLHALEGHALFIQSMLLSHTKGHFIAISGNQIALWNWESGKRVAQFTADGTILSCWEADDGTIVAGDGLGRVHFLKLVIP